MTGDRAIGPDYGNDEEYLVQRSDMSSYFPFGSEGGVGRFPAEQAEDIDGAKTRAGGTTEGDPVRRRLAPNEDGGDVLASTRSEDRVVSKR